MHAAAPTQGLLIDTDVWVLGGKAGGEITLGRWAQHGGACMSAVTAGELLVGVGRANTAQRGLAHGPG